MPARDPIIFTSHSEAERWAAMHQGYLENNRRKLRACHGVYSVHLELVRRGHKPARLVARGARNRALFQIELEKTAPADQGLNTTPQQPNMGGKSLD